jgi:hypothetical protein
MENREKTNGGEAEIELINQLYIGNKIENKKNVTEILLKVAQSRWSPGEKRLIKVKFIFKNIFLTYCYSITFYNLQG